VLIKGLSNVDVYSTIAEIVSAASSRQQREEGGDRLPVNMTEHVVCNLDLLSTMCRYYLLDESVWFLAQFRLLPRLFITLAAPSFDQEVRFVHNYNNATIYKSSR